MKYFVSYAVLEEREEISYVGYGNTYLTTEDGAGIRETDIVNLEKKLQNELEHVTEVTILNIIPISGKI